MNTYIFLLLLLFYVFSPTFYEYETYLNKQI